MTRAARNLVSVCALTWFTVIGAGVLAQNTRSGVRVEYTAIETQGGLTGRAFLPFSTRDVMLLEGDTALPPECPATRRLRATARLPRGAVREVSLTLALRAPATFPLDAARCAEATVDTRLEDGTELRGGRGVVTVQSYTPPGVAPGLVVGTFSQTAMRVGAPVTVRGEFRIPLPAATRSMSTTAVAP